MIIQEDPILDNIENAVKQRREREQQGRITRQINGANNQNIDKYKTSVGSTQNAPVQKKNSKRTITRPKKMEKGTKYVAAFLLAVGIVSGSIYAKNEIEDYKEEQAAAVLDSVKEELGAKSIYDNSSVLGANSTMREYEVVTQDGQKYIYRAYNEGNRKSCCKRRY